MMFIAVLTVRRSAGHCPGRSSHRFLPGGKHLIQPRTQGEDHVFVDHVGGEEKPVGICFQKGKAEFRVAHDGPAAAVGAEIAIEIGILLKQLRHPAAGGHRAVADGPLGLEPGQPVIDRLLSLGVHGTHPGVTVRELLAVLPVGLVGAKGQSSHFTGMSPSRDWTGRED